MINESLGGCKFRQNLLEVRVSLVLKAFYFIGNIIISMAELPEAAFAVFILS